MKTITDLLRDADPLRHEPASAGHQRDRRRQAVLAAASPVGRRLPSRRRQSVAVLAILAIAVITALIIGSHTWFRATVADLHAAVRFEIRLAEEKPDAGLQAAAVARTSRTVYLHPEVIVGNDDVATAGVVQDDAPSRFRVTVAFNPAGAGKMRQATADHLGRPLAVLIDGDVVMAPVLRGPIDDSAVISGGYTRVEAERIVNGIGRR